MRFTGIRRRYRNSSMLSDSLIRDYYDVESGLARYEYGEFANESQDNDYNNAALWIRAKIRRHKSLKKCKKFLSKTNSIYKLRNRHVIIIFDTKAKIMTCRDRKNIYNSGTVIWAKQAEALENKPDNSFEEAFDIFCISFDENSQYQPILESFTEFFEEVEVTKEEQKSKIQINNSEKKTCLYVDEYFNNNTQDEQNKQKLNINAATEKEITNLPGINVIMAKRIIKYRDLHGGFNSLGELYSEMKIKPHFQLKLNDLICVREVKTKQIESKPDERIIDF